MIYLWEKIKSCTNKMIAAYNQEQSPDRFLFFQGMELSPGTVTTKIIFEMELTKAVTITQFDCIQNNSGSPLVNQKIVDLLLQLVPDQVQFFDTEVHCPDGVLTDYKLLNITRTFSGVNFEQSICQMMSQSPDVILGFEHLMFKPGCMGELSIARSKEYFPNVCVAEEVKKAFEKEKITGTRFIQPEEWYASIYRMLHRVRHSQEAMDNVAKKMDSIVAEGQSKDWNESRYREELHAMLAKERSQLRAKRIKKDFRQ